MILKFNSLSIPEMRSIASNIAEKLHLGDIITLSGEVGAGKTTYARFLIQTLAGEDIEVTSPTFTLIQPYDVKLSDGTCDTLWHLDLYRLESGREAEELALEELQSHIMLIEWPGIIEHWLPDHRLDITLDLGDRDDTRNLVLKGSTIWQERLKDLQ